MYTVEIFLIYIFLIIIDFVPLLKSKNYKDITVYSFLITFSFIICLLMSLGIAVPNPVKPIEIVINKLFGI